MYSEIENILKGKVNVTPDYETAKKAIGISTSNLVPNAQGIVPLGKQNSFIKENYNLENTEMVDLGTEEKSNIQEEIENFDWNNFFNKGNDESMSATDLPNLSNELPAPNNSDVLSENPVEVENVQNMNSLSSTPSEPDIEVKPAIEPETVASIPQMEIPTMPEEIVASEPVATENKLFEETVFDPVPEIAPAMPEPIAEPTVTGTLVNSVVPAVEDPVPEIAPAMPEPVVESTVTETIVNPIVPAVEDPVPEIAPAMPEPAIEQENKTEEKNIKNDKFDGIYISNSNLNEIASIIREAADRIVNIIEKCANIEETVDKKEEYIVNQKPINSAIPETKEVVNDVMNDAINQIQNMIVPVVEENGELKM